MALINLRNALMTGEIVPPSEKYILRLKSGIDLRCNALLPDGDFTISLWYKGYSRGANNEVYKFGWRESSGWGGTRAMNTTSTEYFRYATGASSTAYNISGITSYGVDQTWHHFAYRKSGNALVVKCDGNIVLNTTTTRSHQGDGTPLSIGSIGNDSAIQWRRGDKSIGFFCLFGRALTDSEITELAGMRTLQASGGLFTDLICGYELSSDTQLADVTGNYPLTLYNYASATIEYTDLLPA
jgi:hypothetical protein